MKSQAPFLDVQSFAMEEVSRDILETSAPVSSPFLSLYEFEEGDGLVNPEADRYAAFLNELYDEEFDEALSGLVSEATAIYEAHFLHEQEDPQTIGYQAERLLTQHFAPLVAESEAMFEALAKELSQRVPNTLSDGEIENIVDRYHPSTELTPNFEFFLGKLKKIAKKGIEILATGGLSLALNKLKPLIKPLLQRVIQTAIGKLPPHLQPIASKLAERLPFLKKNGKKSEPAAKSAEPAAAPAEPAAEPAQPSEVAEIQYEFNQHIANLLFARTELEQDLEVANALTEPQVPATYPVAELDRARDSFVENLQHLKEGEDPTPHIENFLPAILPALRIGVKLVGRKKVVDFLAKLLGKLIQKLVGPQNAIALSQAIVDAGLRLLQMEAAPENESRAAASAVASTVEETVRRLAAAPEYVLEDQELLEGFALEAFEQAAAANLPQVLPEETYRKRPDLTEARRLRGIWMMMPFGRRRPYRFKKWSRRIPITITPHKATAVETSKGISLGERMEEQLGMAPGEEVEAFMHLYEGIPGTHLHDITRLDESTPGLESADGQEQLHPLTREAAGLLLGEPELGRDVENQYLADPYTNIVGQRFYYMEIPGKRPLMTPMPGARAKMRRPTQVRLILDFPKNEIRVYLFLSEIRAQEFAVKLRQHTHLGTVTARLRKYLDRGLHRAFKGMFGRLKIIHEAVTPGQWSEALRRLPVSVPQVLLGRLQEWVLKGLFDHLKQRTEEFIKAAEDTADGVTFVIALENPPGFPQIRQALGGKGVSLGSLKLSHGTPTVKIKIMPGYSHE